MAEIERILARLEVIFKATKLKHVIVGGIAVNHYGHIRTTQDINIIIEDDYSKITQFIGLLRTYEFEVLEDQFKLAYQEKTNISIFDQKSFLRLDIKVADKKQEREVLSNAIKGKILGKDLFIAPLEYVLIGKLIFMGLIDDIPTSELLEYQDVVDFLTLFHPNKEKINKSFVVDKAKELGLKSTHNKLFSINI